MPRRAKPCRTIAGWCASGLLAGKVGDGIEPVWANSGKLKQNPDFWKPLPHGYNMHFVRPNWKAARREDAG